MYCYGSRGAAISQINFSPSLPTSSTVGREICNSIYVNNLIDAIRLVPSVPAADQDVFIFGDREPSRGLTFTNNSLPDLP